MINIVNTNFITCII